VCLRACSLKNTSFLLCCLRQADSWFGEEAKIDEYESNEQASELELKFYLGARFLDKAFITFGPTVLLMTAGWYDLGSAFTGAWESPKMT
jgi:hypothetical protein